MGPLTMVISYVAGAVQNALGPPGIPCPIVMVNQQVSSHSLRSPDDQGLMSLRGESLGYLAK